MSMATQKTYRVDSHRRGTSTSRRDYRLPGTPVLTALRWGHCQPEPRRQRLGQPRRPDRQPVRAEPVLGTAA